MKKSIKAKTKIKKRKPKKLDYRSHILKNPFPYNNRLMVGIPMTGVVRSEWMIARYGQIIPTNWSALDLVQWIDTTSPMNYMVADARNMIVSQAVEKDMEWLLFIDHDVILPPDTFLRLNDYIREGKHPVVAGLYYTRSHPSEPLIYRGRGRSFHTGWQMGDKVWVDGIHMGCTLINMKIMKAMWEESPEYRVANEIVRKVYETPNNLYFDPETGATNVQAGTEDLYWCDRVIREGFLEKAGFKSHQKKKYPFLVDTAIACTHIDISGEQFPRPNFHLTWKRGANWNQYRQQAIDKSKGK